MTKKQLIELGMIESERMGIEVSRTFMMRLVNATLKRLEKERERRESMLVNTPDSYLRIDYSDPTGEKAVREVIKMLCSQLKVA